MITTLEQAPRLITARYAGKCAKCNGAIGQLNQVIHYPSSKNTYHVSCGYTDYMSFWGQQLSRAAAAYNAVQRLMK